MSNSLFYQILCVRNLFKIVVSIYHSADVSKLLTGCFYFLVPAHLDDPTEATTHFNTEFLRRYGGVSQPIFYAGSFKDAVDTALNCPPVEVFS